MAGADLYGNFGSVPDQVSVNGTGASGMSIRATPESMGAGVGKAVEGVGDQAQQIVQKYQQISTESKVNDDYANKYVPAAAQLRSQYDQLEGQDKIHGYDGYINSLQELNKQFTQSQPSFIGQKMMSGQINRHIASEVDGAKRELVESQKNYAAQSTWAAVKANNKYAADNYNNPQLVDDISNRNRALLTIHADNNDVDTTSEHGQSYINEATRQANSDLAMQSITRASASGDVSEAYKTLSKFSSDIPGDKHIHMDNVLFTQAQQQNGINSVSAIKNGLPLPPPSGFPPFQVQAVVADAAQSNGIDPNHALTVARIESNMGQNLGKRGDIGQTGKGGDLNDQASNMVAELKKSQDVANKALGRPSEPWEQYACYQQGEAGGPALLSAASNNPNAKAIDVLKSVYRNPNDAKSAILNNGGNATMTSGDFLNHIHDLYNSNEKKASCDIPEGVNIAEAITKPYNSPGVATQPAATPKQALINYESKVPQWMEQINSITNYETRARVMEAFKADYAAMKGASNAYTQTLLNQSYQLMTKKDFNIDKDVAPEIQSALASDAPQTLIAMQTRSDHIAEHGQAKEEKDNGAEWGNVVNRMRLPPGDPNRLTEESQLFSYVNNGLTMKGWEDAKKLLGKDDNLKKFYEQGQKQLDGSSAMNVDQEGARRAYEWYSATSKLIEDGEAAGKSVQSMIDPASKDYVGNNIQNFQESLATQTKNMAQRLRAQSQPAIPKEKMRQPGESSEDYLKRMGL